MSSPRLHALVANFSSRTLQAGVSCDRRDACVPSPGGGPPEAGPHTDGQLYPSFQGCVGPPVAPHMEGWPSPILEA